MSNKILLKKSSVSAKVPLSTDLDYGELALNYADNKLYFKDSSNNIQALYNYTLPTASNSTLGGVKVDGTTITINGSGVISSTGGGSSQTYSRTTVTATAGQTTFTATYTVGLVIVYVNGILLDSSSYTASNGTSVVLTNASVVGDTVEIISFAASQQMTPQPSNGKSIAMAIIFG